MNSKPNIYQLDLFPPVLATRKVGANCHVSFEGVYYSVPHELYDSMVIVRASKYFIDILDHNGRPVASHSRCHTKRSYITLPSHMPLFYRSDLDCACYDGAALRKWAKRIGEDTFKFIDAMLSNKDIEEQAYKSCMAVLQLANKYGSARLNSACGYALSVDRISFSFVRKFISIGSNNKLLENKKPILCL